MPDLTPQEALDMGVVPAQPARLNVTWNGSNGEYVNDIPYDVSDADVKALAQEALESDSIPGIERGANPIRLNDFVVERFPANGELPNRIFLRPKTPFGADGHCPFCDATRAEVARSVKAFGLGAPLMCDYCQRRHPVGTTPEGLEG